MRRTKRAAVSVAMFSRFAIYANVVRRTWLTYLPLALRGKRAYLLSQLAC